APAELAPVIGVVVERQQRLEDGDVQRAARGAACRLPGDLRLWNGRRAQLFPQAPHVVLGQGRQPGEVVDGGDVLWTQAEPGEGVTVVGDRGYRVADQRGEAFVLVRAQPLGRPPLALVEPRGAAVEVAPPIDGGGNDARYPSCDAA